MKTCLLILAVLLTNQFTGSSANQGDTLKAAFIGNSYTSVNDLPQITKDVAASAGDQLITGVNAPGGYTLQQHSTDATTLSMIQQGNCDYVVLQEQSQRPAFPISQVQTEVFPYARALDSIISVYNICGETVFYMTWGYENGDQSNCATWPPVCTYEGMDSLLQLRYTMMAQDNNAALSPVGKVRRYIRNNYPSVQLYQADGSHPTEAASYIAACCFYTVFFQKNPELITYDYTLTSTDAQLFREVVKAFVFDSLSLYIAQSSMPVSDFTYSSTDDTIVSFINSSVNADTYLWNFDDGNTSADQSPVHSFPDTGTYVISLVSYHCSHTDTSWQTIHLSHLQSIQNPVITNSSFLIYPDPVGEVLNLKVTNSKNITKLIIVDQIGQTIFETIRKQEENIQINTASLRPGIYSLLITYGSEHEKQYCIRFIRQ
ncbi:MAG: PKD domain-containing protein [Bacteroidia bacterium]|nr:PKD domain-containing protein [Bacteroidia bacterium]